MTKGVRKVITNKRGKIALIHIAKDAVGLDDEHYRLFLEGAAGVRSSKDIQWEDQFIAVMNAFKRLGFHSWKAQGRTTSRPRWEQPWGCTPAQRAKIEVMWQTCARNKSTRSLHAFMRRIVHVDHPRWMNAAAARKVILALEQMMAHAGYDPATGGRIDT